MEPFLNTNADPNVELKDCAMFLLLLLLGVVTKRECAMWFNCCRLI